MTPAHARSTTRRGQTHVIHPTTSPTNDLFIDPMLGSPLALYIEKDVDDREQLVDIITNYGGTVVPSYSGVPYILVDPLKPSGQNLYRQYASKKGKIVLDARWVHECVKAGELQAFASNWAGCKVTGNELAAPTPMIPVEMQTGPSVHIHTAKKTRNPIQQLDQRAHEIVAPQTILPQAMHARQMVEELVPPHFYPMYMPPRPMHHPGPPQTWQDSSGIAPQQTQHMPPQQPPAQHPVASETWEYSAEPDADQMDASAAAPYDFNYRDDQPWVPPHQHYDYSYQPFDHGPPSNSYLEEAQPHPEPHHEPPPPQQQHQPPPQPLPPPPHPAVQQLPPPPPQPAIAQDDSERPRGRKRTRTQTAPAPPTSSLVAHNPAARSPSPPSRVIKSTYGGNLFTSEDVEYLKKYISYCREEGLVLSLREICLRIAVKAPHHTFYSWRRYCNKHQIRLGGYTMTGDGQGDSPQEGGGEGDDEDEHVTRANVGFGTTISAAQERIRNDPVPRARSPTPPRALFRSTTGKGVAFTVDDIAFLIRFMEYRKSTKGLDMVTFWKDVAARAPHHSRASWMKFWRRHKHELNRTEADEPLPQPPEKKMRYSREDDILLAKYFLTKPEGTSDQIFQTFGRQHNHHPWKGWQEHHRIHKVKIDHFMQQLANGETIPDDL